MARTQTMVQLSDELLARLDAEAARASMSRSALIRQAVSEYLERSSHQAAVARYVDGYRRIPQGAPDEWGDVGEAGERARREVHARLDAEERAAGRSW